MSRPQIIPPDHNLLPTPLFYHLIYYSSVPLVPILSHLHFLHLLPSPKTVSLSVGFRAAKVWGEPGRVIHSTLAFACINPTTTAAAHREPGTKWSIYWLNEKIAFFYCWRTLHLMCVMQRPQPVMGSASLLSGDMRK